MAAAAAAPYLVTTFHRSAHGGRRPLPKALLPPGCTPLLATEGP